MRTIPLTSCLSVLAIVTCGAAAAEALPDDQEVTVDGIMVACAGIGRESTGDPRWSTYPVRIEFADDRAEYLADLDIRIATAKGAAVLAVRCNGPWFLAKLPSGKYKVSATYEGRLTSSAKFMSPARGQSRVIVRFPVSASADGASR